MKIFTTKDPRIKVSEFKNLIDMPIVVRVNKFNEESAKKFSEDIASAHDTKQPVIPVIIDSYGGQAYSLLAMIGEIESSKVPVATICLGKAMSCGALLLGHGTPGYRFMEPNSTAMLHDVSSFSWGKVEEMKSSVKESERLNKLVYQKLAKVCNHKDKDYFLRLFTAKKHADWFMTAQEAKQHKLIDHIGVPSFEVKVSASVDFKI